MFHTGILSSNLDWKQLHQSAMVELGVAELPRRIAEARTAMLDRAKEIFDRTGMTSSMLCAIAYESCACLRNWLPRINQQPSLYACG